VIADGGDLNPARFAVGGELAAFLNDGRTSTAAITTPQCRGVDRDSRIGDAIEYLHDNIKDLRSLESQPYTGEEVVGRLVSWTDDSIPVREIAFLIIREYESMVRVLEKFRAGESGDGPRQ
jgi:hypothetical protein